MGVVHEAPGTWALVREERGDRAGEVMARSITIGGKPGTRWVILSSFSAVAGTIKELPSPVSSTSAQGWHSAGSEGFSDDSACQVQRCGWDYAAVV